MEDVSIPDEKSVRHANCEQNADTTEVNRISGSHRSRKRASAGS